MYLTGAQHFHSKTQKITYYIPIFFFSPLAKKIKIKKYKEKKGSYWMQNLNEEEAILAFY